MLFKLPAISQNMVYPSSILASIKPHDFIIVKTKNEEFSGIFIQSPNKALITIKLSNGYNIGVEKRNIISIEKKPRVTEDKKENEKTNKDKKHIQQNKSLPKISIISIGGTITSSVDYTTGAVMPLSSPEDIIQNIPELSSLASLTYKQPFTIMSESLRFQHYNILAKEIEKEIKSNPKGIIITHGTDTLHFTAAALAFMLENPPTPIILVGSQRSSDRPSSDSSSNLLNAVNFIIESDFKGIAICMHSSSSDDNCFILPATKTRKLHTSRRDAFKPINSLPIAKVSFRENKISYIEKPHSKEGKLIVKYFKENIKIGIIRSHTNLQPENISSFKGYKGLILEGTGLGHFPISSPDKYSKINLKIKAALQKLIKSGCIIILTSQCLFGRVNMNVYSPQKELQELGVLSGQDMLSETAFIKLAFLLSNYPPSKVKQLMQENLRGEINERILPDQYFEEK